MSTGSVAVVLAQTPNQFRGCQTIGKIFFILDLVLFVPFTALICTRFIIAPKKLWLSMHHPVEGLFFGTYWVSIALIINCIQLYGVSSSGTWLVTTLRVLFWIYSCAVLIVAIFQYFVLFQNSRLSVNDAMPAWIFPIYPLLVVGTMAGVMIDSQPKGSAYPMWAGAVMFQGLAWAVSFMMYTIYTQRLMTSHLPTPSTRPGMFVSVGPGSKCRAIARPNINVC